MQWDDHQPFAEPDEVWMAIMSANDQGPTQTSLPEKRGNEGRGFYLYWQGGNWTHRAEGAKAVEVMKGAEEAKAVEKGEVDLEEAEMLEGKAVGDLEVEGKVVVGLEVVDFEEGDGGEEKAVVEVTQAEEGCWWLLLHFVLHSNRHWSKTFHQWCFIAGNLVVQRCIRFMHLMRSLVWTLLYKKYKTVYFPELRSHYWRGKQCIGKNIWY